MLTVSPSEGLTPGHTGGGAGRGHCTVRLDLGNRGLVSHTSKATLKKSLFPVQWVTTIVVSQAAANCFPRFFKICFFCKKILKIKCKKNLICKNEKKSPQSAVIYSPGRYTGNNTFLKADPICVVMTVDKAML